MVRQSLGPELLRVTFLLYASIHRSAWKVNSANFAITAFYEVRSPLDFVTKGRRNVSETAGV